MKIYLNTSQGQIYGWAGVGASENPRENHHFTSGNQKKFCYAIGLLDWILKFTALLIAVDNKVMN